MRRTGSVGVVRRFSRDGVQLAYDDVGAGFPVVLHTGGAGSSSMWREGGYVERLAGFRLILLDHRGRGQSDRPKELALHRVGEFVADVAAVVDHEGCSEFAFLGYSFGGLVGLHLAARDPRVKALIVLGTVFDPANEEIAPSTYADPVLAGGMEAVIQSVELEEGLTLPPWTRDAFMETDAEQFRLTIEANVDDPDPWEILPDIRATTVLIAGSEEDPKAVQDKMAATMRDASSIYLAGVGHVGAFLKPDEVVQAALPTLRRAAAD